jgi:hypothetical protein
VQEVVGVRANPAEDAEDELREERRCDETAIEEVGERVEMADVVPLFPPEQQTTNRTYDSDTLAFLKTISGIRTAIVRE